MSTERKKQTENLVLGAILTAIVVVLQILGGFIKFGPFSVSLVLIPIVIGAAKCGVKIGTWLGLVFGTVVLLNGDATAFFAVNVFGTVLTVLLKGAACGFARRGSPTSCLQNTINMRRSLPRRSSARL